MPSGGSPVQSIDRVFDVMETLSGSSHGMTLTDLSAAVGLHVSTTHRLLSALSVRGYVQKDAETGKYRLTMRLFEIGSRVIGGMNLLSVSRPFLEHLADFTGETVHLVARHGDEVVYLYKDDNSNSVIRMASFVGLRNPMYCTAVGKSILAHLPEAEVRGIWERTVITAFTPRTITRYRDLTAELELSRQRGYAVDDEEHELGVLCLAAPIFDFAGAPVGAVSVSAPAVRVSQEKREIYAKQIIVCTNGVTSLLGGQLPTAPRRQEEE